MEERRDLTGRPAVDPLTGRQQDLAFPLPSALDLEVQRQAVAWKQARCPATASLFSELSTDLQPLAQEY